VPALGMLVVGSFLVTRLYPQSANDVLSDSPSALVRLPFHGAQRSFFVDTPEKAFAYIKSHEFPPRMFNEYTWGGGIIWALPEHKTFIDGRMPHWKRGDRHIFRDYLIISKARKGWQEIVARYDIQWFFVRKNAAIAVALEQFPDVWGKRYEDEQAVIFVKR